MAHSVLLSLVKAANEFQFEIQRSFCPAHELDIEGGIRHVSFPLFQFYSATQRQT